MDGSLSGRVAIVTGAGRGLGRAIALGLADAGADVAVIGRSREHLDSAAAEIESRGRRSLALTADLTDIGRIPELFAHVRDEFGDLHLLVNNHGFQGDCPAVDVSEKLYDQVLDTNLKSLYFCCQAAGRYFIERGRGKIINLGSTFSVVGAPNFSAYCASKGGVLLLTKALATEWAGKGVNVNAIGPTAVRTEMMAPLLDDPDFRAGFMPKVPAGRLPEPEDVAQAAVFLAGPGSDMIHGTILMVDCGFTAL